jgi:hypothetical protein
MAKKQEKNYQEKYELMVEPTTIVTRAPDRQRINLKNLTMEQADKIYASEGQQILRMKDEQSAKNA